MLKIFIGMVAIELSILRKNMLGKLLNSFIWGGTSLSVMTYIMPKLGLQDFGLFQAPTIIIGVIGFELYNQIFVQNMQIAQKSDLFYLFSLPIKRWVVFAKLIIVNTFTKIILAISMIFLCKIVLQQKLNCASIAWTKLFVTIVCASFLFTSWGMLMVSFVKGNINKVGNVFSRVMFPLWFIGGFQFSWNTLLELNKPLGYFALISPYTYAHEAARGAVLGAHGFMNFEICITAMILISALFTYLGYKRIVKYLDLSK